LFKENNAGENKKRHGEKRLETNEKSVSKKYMKNFGIILTQG